MKMIKTDYQDIHEHVGKLYKSIKESIVSDIIIIAVARRMACISNSGGILRKRRNVL